MPLDLLEHVKKHRIVVAVRGIAPEQILPAAKALYDGGIRMLEITFDQASPTCLTDTPAAIRQVRQAMGDDMLVGAGTVMSPEQARAAVEAGAQYLLTPNLDLEVIAAARVLDVPIVPGAMTPSEIAAAWKAGAALVKLFPAGCLGPGYIKAITAPIRQVPLLTMGGVDETNLTEYLSLPCVVGTGIGSAITRKDLIEAGRWQELTALALRYTSQLTGKEGAE